MTDRLPALFALDPVYLPKLFPEPNLRRLQAVLDIDPDHVVRDFGDPRAAEALAETEVLVTGWGAPPLDPETLARAGKLRAILHSAGSVQWVDRAVHERGIAVSSAADANAVPVAEYTLGTILLAGKNLFGLRDRFRAERGFVIGQDHTDSGNYGRTIGLIGASRIGRRVIELLRHFDFEVLLADPHVAPEEADRLGVRLVGLDKLFAASDIVSVHAPDLPETRRLVNAERLAAMKDGAVLINTARGALVDTDALVAELATGRISAIIDVTDPEPLPPASPLFDLPNLFLTPHVAGSQGNELARMGRFIIEEAERLAAGEPLVHAVDPRLLSIQA
ncbi:MULTISPECIES: hydroxyacid dehydrogenase [Glycomyces]|uniref:Hydroxyacid dehydrogenase n=2 Tax=Glycomyces TaxID=58113 RepID=A0A9X3PL50_9ACTN|nr:hydroxyacid dehydrogenase [Glycomyces lechevalierae]MDA1385924.1 hydroxyacid dehydrogenase [Glycomyces lechevalierae]MDR7340919.1 phosphoglycerate dehydrogenase-like enzyme [Glycomyces lechevalierae]